MDDLSKLVDDMTDRIKEIQRSPQSAHGIDHRTLVNLQNNARRNAPKNRTIDMTEVPFSQVTQPFGDADYVFALSWAGAQEWEDKTGRSLFQTFNAMVTHQDGLVSDVREIIRIALIGGGLAPTEALKLVRRYVENRPLAETIPIALTAVEAFLFGTDGEKPEKPATDE
ncbi:gene transfer agent family protein [Brucella anthropi]|nr:gene transfer agent family protein [Brucella anthropi]UVV66693.1 gene transfer agent family protein [Brucella anthropi]